MSKYAVIDESDDLIVNKALWDNLADVPDIDGHRIILDANDEWHIGGTLTVGLSYTPPEGVG